MSTWHSEFSTTNRLCLHPSVGLRVDSRIMTPSQKVAAVAKVRCLEHDLFVDERPRAGLAREEAEEKLSRLNHLRRALGWLEIDLDGQLRWPHLAEAAVLKSLDV